MELLRPEGSPAVILASFLFAELARDRMKTYSRMVAT
jgi:hypothetical protein